MFSSLPAQYCLKVRHLQASFHGGVQLVHGEREAGAQRRFARCEEEASRQAGHMEGQVPVRRGLPHVPQPHDGEHAAAKSWVRSVEIGGCQSSCMRINNPRSTSSRF